MARNTDPLPVTGTETIIGAGVKIKGVLHSEGDITIDGWLDGEIKAAGNVIVGVNGVIKADVTAMNVLVSGSLRGNIEAEEEANISDTGNVRGNITCSRLGIASGAIFVGRSTMVKTTHEKLEGDNQDAGQASE